MTLWQLLAITFGGLALVIISIPTELSSPFDKEQRCVELYTQIAKTGDSTKAVQVYRECVDKL